MNIERIAASVIALLLTMPPAFGTPYQIEFVALVLLLVLKKRLNAFI